MASLYETRIISSYERKYEWEELWYDQKMILEVSYLSNIWREEFNNLIKEHIKKYRWYWPYRDEQLFDEIYEKLTDEELRRWIKNEKYRFHDEEKLLKHDPNPERLKGMIRFYVIALAKARGFNKLMGKPKRRKCLLCNNKFDQDAMPIPLFERLGEDFDRVRFCAPCLTSHIFSPGKDEMKKEDILEYIRNLTNVIQRIPHANFGERKSDFLGFTDDERTEIFRLIKDRPSRKAIKKHFSTWFEALVTAGVIEGDARRNARGIQCLGKDGHTCLSLGEKTICDLLHDLGIKHNKEVKYPEGNYRADFEVNGVFIEYFGLDGDPDYDKKSKIKQQICKKHGITLISVYPKDLADLNRLERKIMKHINVSIK